MNKVKTIPYEQAVGIAHQIAGLGFLTTVSCSTNTAGLPTPPDQFHHEFTAARKGGYFFKRARADKSYFCSIVHAECEWEKYRVYLANA